jgi:hypothetical protein
MRYTGSCWSCTEPASRTARSAATRCAAAAASIKLPELAEPRRVSWPTLIMIIGTLIGGWALIGVLIDVSKSFDTVIGADWLWVIMALVLAQLAYVASGVEAVGSVSGPLPFGRAVAVEVANAFSALAGGTAAVFATRVRFYQRQGYDATGLDAQERVSMSTACADGNLTGRYASSIAVPMKYRRTNVGANRT